MKKMVPFLRLDFPEVILRLVTFAQNYQKFYDLCYSTKYKIYVDYCHGFAILSRIKSKTCGLRLKEHKRTLSLEASVVGFR